MRCPIMLKIAAGVASMGKMKSMTLKPIKALAKTSPNRVKGLTKRMFKTPTMKPAISPSISKAFPLSIDDSLARRKY